jgi:hypothetical protein
MGNKNGWITALLVVALICLLAGHVLAALAAAFIALAVSKMN